MKLRNLTISLLVASAPFATSAMAQDATAGAPAATASAAATPAVGASVYDATGAEVGTIKSIAAPNFVIDTGSHTATLALSALGNGAKGPVLGLTKAELDTAAEKAAADAKEALAAAVAVDAQVYASDNTTVLGKIAEVTDTDFVLDTGTARVKLPRTAVGKSETGLFLGMTAQQFADATKSATASN